MDRTIGAIVIALAAVLPFAPLQAQPRSDHLSRLTPSLAHARPQKSGSAQRAGPGLNPTPAALAAERAALLAEIRSAPPDNAASGIAAGPVNASAGPHGAQRIRSETSLAGQDRKPCSQTSPFINGVKGSLTPGGQLAVDGLCLGSQGELRIYGTFPGGSISLPILVWSEKGVAGAVPPDISGVIEQPVLVRITRSDGRESNQRTAIFHPKLQEITVPSDLIVLRSCAIPPGGSAIGNTCQAEPPPMGNHSYGGDPPNGYNGNTFATAEFTDDWDIVLAKGWAITEVDWSGTDIAAVDGLDAPTPPEVLNLGLRWRFGDSIMTGDTHCETGPLLVSCVPMELVWLSNYQFQVHAVGPVGVSFYPPKGAPSY